MEDARKLLNIRQSECPDIWMCLPRHKWPKSCMVQYGRPSRSSWTESARPSFGKTTVGKAIWEESVEAWLGENSKLGMSLCSSRKRIILISVCGWHKIGWKETQYWSDVKSTQQRSRFGRTNIFPGSCILGICTQRKCEISKDIVDNYRTMFEWENQHLWLRSKTMWNKQRYCGQLQNHVRIANFRGWNRNCQWYYDMEGHAKKCVERYCELATKTTQQLYKVSTPCIDDHHFKKKKWNLLEICHMYPLILFWNVDIWHVF